MNAPGIIVLLGFSLITTPFLVTVEADFTLTIKFINYTNPSGLCAECNTSLVNFTVDNIVPVCCDEMPLRNDSCNNVGESRCNTRFRWILREYGGSLVDRPGSAMSPVERVYYFNPCGQTEAMCPFNEMSRTFEDGNNAFLGRRNPFLANSSDPWTGRIQFFIESVETALPNIIDSFLINLDNLQLGANFTEEMTYTGYHNISLMRMSFKVECAPGYCGSECTTSVLTNPLISTCESNGEAVCVNDKLDPNLLCAACIDTRFNSSTECSTCLNTAYDPATNCSTCVNPNLDESTDCMTCVNAGYSRSTNCSQCLTNRDPSTNCTNCLPGYTGEDCLAVTVPPTIPTTVTPATHPTVPTTIPTTVPTTTPTTLATLGADLIGGIAGGVGGALLLIIIILIVIVITLTCQVKRRSRGKFNVSDRNVENLSNNVYQHSTDTGTGTSVEHKFQNPIYGSGMKLNESDVVSPTALTTSPGGDNEEMISNMIYDSASIPGHEDYSQLRHTSVTPPSHKVKTGTNELNTSLSPVDQDLPVYDSANYTDETSRTRGGTGPRQEEYSQLRHLSVSPPDKTGKGLSVPQDAPVYDSANYTDEQSQPVYAEADGMSGPEAPLSGQHGHPSKLAAAYEEVDDDFQTTAELPVYDVASYPPSQSVPSSSGYAVLEAPDGNGSTELPAYDVTDHSLPPSLKQQSSFTGGTPNIPPGLYGTANYTDAPTHQYDYADSTVRTDLTSSLPSSKRHAYDYIDNPLDSEPNPTVYTNTLPGKLTAECLDHYDFGP